MHIQTIHSPTTYNPNNIPTKDTLMPITTAISPIKHILAIIITTPPTTIIPTIIQAIITTTIITQIQFLSNPQIMQMLMFPLRKQLRKSPT